MDDATDPSSVTRLAEAREWLRSLVAAHERTETRPLAEVVGRPLAAPVAAQRAVPHYDRVAVDGYAVQAADTHERLPTTLTGTDGEVRPGSAAAVDSGAPLPAGADAVVPMSDARQVDDDIEITAAVTPGAGVDAAGAEMGAGERLYPAGHRLGPADLGVLRAAGHDRVGVREPPRVRVVPTGDRVVAPDGDGEGNTTLAGNGPGNVKPTAGEVVESDALVVSRLVERWGGTAAVEDPVAADVEALATAVAAGGDGDLLVTTGGTGDGERDRVPAVVADRGSLAVHGLAISPGRSAAFGTVGGTPVVCLPGEPVDCLVAAAQLVRPAVAAAGGFVPDSHPTTTARLARKLHSVPGRRTFARVTVADGRATPVGTAGHGVVTGGADADSTTSPSTGWVAVPESMEGYDAGSEVAVERWTWWP